MTRALLHKLRRFAPDRDGAVAVEFAIVASLMFFLFFALIDFGRLAFSQVMAEKAVHLAARTAAVRPPACTGVPAYHVRGGASPAPRFGTSCAAGANTCLNPGTVTCLGSAGNATASEIWTAVQPWLPPNATTAHVRYTYTFDANLGFLGGPYVPMLTVDLDLPAFQFIAPIGALAQAAGAASDPVGTTFTYPDFSMSLPAEDLALGEAG